MLPDVSTAMRMSAGWISDIAVDDTAVHAASSSKPPVPEAPFASSTSPPPLPALDACPGPTAPPEPPTPAAAPLPAAEHAAATAPPSIAAIPTDQIVRAYRFITHPPRGVESVEESRRSRGTNRAAGAAPERRGA